VAANVFSLTPPNVSKLKAFKAPFKFIRVPARPFKRQDKNPLKVNSNNNNNGEIDFTNNNKRYTFRNKNIYLNIIYTK